MHRILALLLLVAPLAAKNVDLVTLPSRDTVQLTIYNSEDLTLVKETRHVTLRKGSNQLQFSWANTLIDPTSVTLRPLQHAGEVEIADTVFPGQKPQHLIWNVESGIDGQIAVEVSYFTSGLTWTMDYVGVCDAAETVMDFDGYVRVFNRSGEEYENASVRLIVGKINLVEQIAELARRQGIPMPKPGEPRYRDLRKEAGLRVAAEAAKSMDRTEKKIVKEGVSEYFMFTVEGEETIRNGWSKRMRAVDADRAAFSIVYRMREHQYGPRPVRFFVWKNDGEHKLGESPLPDGRIRLFRRQGDGLGFLGEQQVRYVPIDAPVEVNLGPDDLVVYERRRARTIRLNFRHGGPHDRVKGWDEQTDWVDTIRNYRDKPIMFELHRVWPGDVELGSEMDVDLFDYRTVATAFEVAPRGRTAFPHRVLVHMGTNARQQRVRIR